MGSYSLWKSENRKHYKCLWNVIVFQVKKPITREKTKPQPLTWNSLWFHAASGIGICLPTEHLKRAQELVQHVSVHSESNWNLAVLVFEEREKSGYPEKNLSEQGENQQQSQPTYDAGTGNRTRATLVGGGCSHPCATPAPPASDWLLHNGEFQNQIKVFSDSHSATALIAFYCIPRLRVSFCVLPLRKSF